MINSDVFNYVNVLDKAADGAWMRNQAIAHNIANAWVIWVFLMMIRQ